MTVELDLDVANDVCCFDDLSVTVVGGRGSLHCPTCGTLAVPLRAPTLSDFTNAALEHLADAHWLARRRSSDQLAAARRFVDPVPDARATVISRPAEGWPGGGD
jgi:hypothetical protein